MSGMEAVALDPFLDGQCMVQLPGPVPVPDFDGVEVILTLRRTWVLKRRNEILEFDDRDDLAHFLWSECHSRVDSLVLLYGMGLLRVTTGPLLARQTKSLEAAGAPAA